MIHSDGDVLKLKFGLIAGTTIKELARIERPDGATLAYLYDTSGNLVEVDKPGNDSAGYGDAATGPHGLAEG